MGFETALRLTAFFVGAFLHGALVFGVLRGARSRPAERVLRAFFFAVFLWHAGSFVALALESAQGPGADLVRRLANLAAFAGLGFLPTLLLDAVMSEGWERLRPRAPRASERAAVIAAYAPLVGIPIPLWQLLHGPPGVLPLDVLDAYRVPFMLWFIGVLLVSAVLSIRIGRATAPADRRLDVRLATSFVLTALGLTYAYLLGGREGPLGYTVETIVMASSIFPSLVFAYHVYRYRVLGYFVRESAVSLLASASVVALYLFLVREGAARLERTLGVPAAVLEGTVLGLLILVFQPYGDSLRALARRTLAGGRERLRHAASACADKLARARDVGDVSAAIRSTLEGTELITRASLLVAEGVPPGTPAAGRLEDVCPQVAAALAEGAEVVRRELPPSAEALAELEGLGAHAALALRTRDRLHGALLVGGKGRRGLYPEDLDELRAVAQAAALALEAARLFAEKIEAERKTLHAERMASLGWLAAGVAHEVKNPLSSIKAVAQVMRNETAEGHPFRADLDVIVAATNRLDEAVERLLASARPGRDTAPPAIPLAQALERLGIALGAQARARGVTFEFRLGAGAARVTADPDALWDVFYNLAVNAIEAMPSGGVFRIEEQAAEDGRVTLEVRDEGPGLAPAIAARVFEPFVTTKAHGHGIGLALVRRRIGELGGTIEPVPSAAGAVFAILLPSR